jgi:hypothetical protein
MKKYFPLVMCLKVLWFKKINSYYWFSVDPNDHIVLDIWNHLHSKWNIGGGGD